MRVDVFTAGMYEGDGVAFDALTIRDTLRAWGAESTLYTDHAHASPWARRIAPHFADFGAAARRHPPAAVIYEYSSLSPVTRFLLGRGEPLLLRYQNVTPPGFFEPYDAEMAARLSAARAELALLAGRAAAGIPPSSFNAAEAAACGLPSGTVVPNFVRMPPFRPRPYDPAEPRLLFVGRVAPNKCQHHLVQMAGALARAGLPGLTLSLVGSPHGCPRYAMIVERLAAQAGNVRMIGHMADPLAAYAGADLFVSASEHEGFCMPLVEAMTAGVPVLAHAACAVPETVGGGGIVFRGKNLPEMVELVSGLLGDPARMEQLRCAGARRALDFTHERVGAALRRALADAGVRV